VAGTVRVAGQLVTGADPGALRQIRRQIGMIFQQFNLVRRASVLDNVLAGRLGYVPEWPSLVGRFPPRDRALARECLAQVDLAEFADRRADTLSGGGSSGWPSRARWPRSRGNPGTSPPRVSIPSGSIMGIWRGSTGRRLARRQPASVRPALEYGTRIVGFRAGVVVFDGPPAAVSPEVVQAIYGEEAA
jgi:phosphonate transport system ATP-binding protein